jgi:F0F1-type ATP synthase membrane subunit c/vacuolar-type H+-ATPase subunit K
MILYTWPFTLRFYLRQLLVPIQYSIFYPMEPVRQPGLANFVAALAIVCAAGAILLALARRSRVMMFGLVLLILPVQSAVLGYTLSYSLYNHIAHCYAELGDTEQAVTYLRDAISMEPLRTRDLPQPG